MMEQNSIAMERNLSKNWADILEELEEQAKEVDQYIEKVSAKYSIDAEKLRNNMETDPQVLRKRQKSINYGKVTAEYQRYILELPRRQRQNYHPRTPNKFRKVSRRKYDGAIKKWRKLLHAYDEDPEQMADMKYTLLLFELNSYWVQLIKHMTKKIWFILPHHIYDNKSLWTTDVSSSNQY